MLSTWPKCCLPDLNAVYLAHMLSTWSKCCLPDLNAVYLAHMMIYLAHMLSLFSMKYLLNPSLLVTSVLKLEA